MHRYVLITLLLLTAQQCAICPAAEAQQWGDVRGKFIYRGEAFAAEPVNSSLIREFCGENLKIIKPRPQISDAGGVGGLLVWLFVDADAAPPTMHPRYETKSPPASQPLRIVNCQFEPHAFFVRAKSPFEVNLQDGDRPHAEHLTWIANRNSHTPPAATQWPQRKHMALKRERMPIPITCSYHPWMKAYAIVTDHPYAVQTTTDGTFVLKDLPVGVHTLQVRHLVGNGGYVDEVVKNGQKLQWNKGRFRIDVKPGINDIGALEIRRAVFE